MRFLLFWVIFVRFRAFFCVLVGCCTFLRVFAYFSALGVPLVALGTLLGALGTLLGRSWGALGRSWALLGRSWDALGRSWDALGVLSDVFCLSFCRMFVRSRVLKRFFSICSRI